MQIGDINIVNHAIDTEFRLGVLEKSFDFILRKNSSLNTPNDSDYKEFREKTLRELQKKYPNMGIQQL